MLHKYKIKDMNDAVLFHHQSNLITFDSSRIIDVTEEEYLVQTSQAQIIVSLISSVSVRSMFFVTHILYSWRLYSVAIP